MLSYTDLGYDELGGSLAQSSFLAGQYHLEHIPLQFLHDDKYSARGLEHTL
jgi:hypothetical protein